MDRVQHTDRVVAQEIIANTPLKGHPEMTHTLNISSNQLKGRKAGDIAAAIRELRDAAGMRSKELAISDMRGELQISVSVPDWNKLKQHVTTRGVQPVSP